MNSHPLRVATNVLRKAHVLILGGGGLVGSAIAKHMGRLPSSMRPSRIVVAALTQQEATRAVKDLEEQCHQQQPLGRVQDCYHPSIDYIPAWGDIFVRHDFANLSPVERKSDPKIRAIMLDDMMGDFGTAYEQNHLVSLVREHKPNVIVDCINTATVLSYQDVFTASTRLRQAMAQQHGDAKSSEGLVHDPELLCQEAENTLLSLGTPQLIRHVRCLQEVSKEEQVDAYLKIGTTGTGGMGFNIPYTHSEDRPSRMLLSKSANAFGHSGLLLLWSMTPGAPSVKELKPAAAIGYKSMDVRKVSDKHGNSSLYGGRLLAVPAMGATSSAVCSIHKTPESTIRLKEDPSQYNNLGPMCMAVVDMGENGVFTKDEFLTITSPGQMELVSPEEISELAIEELLSVSTGYNVLSAMRGTLLGPGYRAGINRMMACEKLERIGDATVVPEHGSEDQPSAASVALGKLGPPEISKLLFEAGVLAKELGTWQALRDCDLDALVSSFEAIVTKLDRLHAAMPGTTENILQTAISVGVPVLVQNHLLRGPNISIPEPIGMSLDIPVPSNPTELDEIANRGWVDLRRTNLERWRSRAQNITEQLGLDENRAANTPYIKGDWSIYKSTKGDQIDPPAVVAWILAVELGGHRDIA